MIKIIKGILSADDLAGLEARLDHAQFKDGRSTAKGMARNVKKNQQLDAASNPELLAWLQKKIEGHEEFKFYTRPKAVTPVRISRYGPGEEYGRHSDNAMIGGVRTDVSFTLFLSDRDSYQGGELEIDAGFSQLRFKLKAGDMVTYPTQYVHRVAPVQSGRRLAAVGWVHSYIREPLKRETLADLDILRSHYLKQHGHDALADLMLKSSKNLERMWLDL